jgi:hypothetical protein
VAIELGSVLKIMLGLNPEQARRVDSSLATFGKPWWQRQLDDGLIGRGGALDEQVDELFEEAAQKTTTAASTAVETVGWLRQSLGSVFHSAAELEVASAFQSATAEAVDVVEEWSDELSTARDPSAALSTARDPSAALSTARDPSAAPSPMPPPSVDSPPVRCFSAKGIGGRFQRRTPSQLTDAGAVGGTTTFPSAFPSASQVADASADADSAPPDSAPPHSAPPEPATSEDSSMQLLSTTLDAPLGALSISSALSSAGSSAISSAVPSAISSTPKRAPKRTAPPSSRSTLLPTLPVGGDTETPFTPVPRGAEREGREADGRYDNDDPSLSEPLFFTSAVSSAVSGLPTLSRLFGFGSLAARPPSRPHILAPAFSPPAEADAGEGLSVAPSAPTP